MTACEHFQDLLVESFYGDLDTRERHRLEAHLAECQSCAAESLELQETVALMRRAMPPAASTARLDDLWDRLEPRLQETATQSEGKVLSFPRRFWLPLAAAAMLILAVVGRMIPGPTAPPGAVGLGVGPGVGPEVAETFSQGVLEDELGRYFARATPLLLSISNRDPSRPALSVDAERRAAQRLAAEAQNLRGDLESKRRSRELNLIKDLEIVFLQLANLCTSEYRQGVELLQTTLDRRAILFQLSVEALRREMGGRETVGRDTPADSTA